MTAAQPAYKPSSATPPAAATSCAVERARILSHTHQHGAAATYENVVAHLATTTSHVHVLIRSITGASTGGPSILIRPEEVPIA